MDAKNSPFLARLDAVAADTEALLDRLLAATPAAGELSRPARLIEAMRYSSLGGGKRFRPFLVVESASLFDVPRQNALMAGAALECVHCYSLVHDDLPAMDNDDLRRGQPTAHRKFDEATAILAGDGLLTFAFDILSRPRNPCRSGRPHRAGQRAGARRRPRRHGRRPDARPRRGGPLRRAKARRATRCGCCRR